jgi:hypothetical protein
MLFGALPLFWAAIGGGAEASTVYTYSFTQDFNYSLGNGGVNPTTLTGGFTGTPDATGHISLSTLTDFHLTFDNAPAGFPSGGPVFGTYRSLPTYFSFLVGDTSGSTLAFQSPLDLLVFTGDETACVGAAVGFLCDGGNSRGIVLASIGAFAHSEIAPAVTLVSSSTIATTPIPGALLLFGTALGALGMAGGWRRRSAPA